MKGILRALGADKGVASAVSETGKLLYQGFKHDIRSASTKKLSANKALALTAGAVGAGGIVGAGMLYGGYKTVASPFSREHSFLGGVATTGGWAATGGLATAGLMFARGGKFAGRVRNINKIYSGKYAKLGR